MHKNQLQELAQRSCFNLPSYSCIREGPDHAPRFKSTVIFNGETFESPAFCTTLRQAEHAAAEVALNAMSKRGPSRSLAARVLDETGVYKNLLQETAHRAGLNQPVYTTIRSGPGHTPIFTCKVELASMSFTGDPAKTKKQAQKNAAMAAWSALKQLPHLGAGLPSSSSQSETERSEEQEQVIVARALAKLHSSDGGKSTQQHDRQSGRRKHVPVWREANPADSAPFYSMMPCQGWVHSNFFPEISMHQTWHQENSPRLPMHYLTLPSPCPTDPISSAYMRQLLPSAQNQYFPVIGHSILNPLPSYVGSPTMYFPVYPSGPSGSRSQVSIQEVPDEKNVLGEMELFDGSISDSDGDPSSRNADISSRNTDYKYGVSDQPLPIDNYGEQKASEFCDKQSNLRQHAPKIPLGGMASNILSFQAGADVSSSSAVSEPLTENMRGTTHLEIKRDDCGRVNCELRSRHPNTNHVSFFPQDTGIHDTAQSASITLHPPDTSSFGPLQGFRPLRMGCSSRASIPVCRAAVRSNECRPRGFSMAPPVTMRTAAPVCSARPGGNLNLPCLPSNVPAVRIRTVQPVCSDPAGRTTTSVQRRSRETETFSPTASEFSKLHI